MVIKKTTPFIKNSLFLASALLLTSTLTLSGQEICTIPTSPTFSGDFAICEGNDALLSATAEADEIRWYTSENQEAPIHTGSDLTLENLEETTSIWAESVNFDTEGQNYTGGARVSPGTYTGGAAVSPHSSPWGLRFNITKDIVLNSVDVFVRSEEPGMIVIQLKDSNYQVLEEKMVTTPAGSSDEPLQHTVDLGFNIPAGINYSLVASSSPSLVRQSQANHSGFPYPLGDVGVITQGMLQDTPGAANATTYYFFYNWDFTAFEDCISERVATEITVNEIPNAPTGNEEQSFTEGETLNDLEVEGSNLTWYADSNGEEELESTTELTDGVTYYVSQSIENCESDLLAITVTFSLGINDINLDKISIYPVPASDVIYISNIEGISQLEIFNTMGQSIKKMDSQDINESIYVGNLSKGMYIIQLNTSSNVITKQIIIE